MSCVRTQKTMSAQLSATTADLRYHWFTGWMPATGLLAMKTVVQHNAVTGTFDSKVAIQTATVRADSPDAPTAKDAEFLSGADKRCSGVIDLSSDTASKFLVRVGLQYRCGSGTFAQADASIDLSWLSCGQLVGARTVRLSTPGTGECFEPVTGWIPALLAEKAAAALVVTGASDAFQVRLAVQKAAVNRENPGAWAGIGSWNDPNPGANGEYHTGEQTLSVASEMWVRLGLAHQLTTGSDGVADVSVAIAARKA